MKERKLAEMMQLIKEQKPALNPKSERILREKVSGICYRIFKMLDDDGDGLIS